MNAPDHKNILKSFLDVIWEILWPTRCAVCDIAGEDVLCKRCENRLKMIDANMACQKCGAPYGMFQCTECNNLMLDSLGLNELPFDSMAHALILDDAARRIISAYKDHDERRLSDTIARIICSQISPDQIQGDYTITYIPDTKKAYRRRGFDHSLETAKKVAELAGMRCETLLERPTNLDQRKLSRAKRIENMKRCMRVKSSMPIPEKILIVDDVCTTGATIYAACSELKRAGAKKITAITFAQVLV